MSGRWANSNRAARLPADWPARRQRILQRDGHRCTWNEQGQRCTATTSLEVDHIHPGDDHTDTNLRTLCGPHHRRKSSAEGNAARPKRRRQPPAHPGLIA